MLEKIKTMTGLSKSEIIRRCVRLMGQELDKTNDIGFIFSRLAPVPQQAESARLNEPLKKYGK